MPNGGLYPQYAPQPMVVVTSTDVEQPSSSSTDTMRIVIGLALIVFGLQYYAKSAGYDSLTDWLKAQWDKMSAAITLSAQPVEKPTPVLPTGALYVLIAISLGVSVGIMYWLVHSNRLPPYHKKVWIAMALIFGYFAPVYYVLLKHLKDWKVALLITVCAGVFVGFLTSFKLLAIFTPYLAVVW